MILALSIRDFVLIDRLDIEPGNGFTALTGETGAGKSIILDALALTLGAAADRAFVRAGAAQASVAAEFAAVPGHPVWEVLAEQHPLFHGPVGGVVTIRLVTLIMSIVVVMAVLLGLLLQAVDVIFQGRRDASRVEEVGIGQSEAGKAG